MAPPNSNHWITDPEYAGLLNYIIEETENVESPINIKQLVREFKEKSGSSQTVKRLCRRIDKVRTRIHSFDHIDKKTKVKLLLALSCSVDAKFLKELKKDALVKVDDKKRITHYKANDGGLERKGDHSLSAKRKTAKRSHWKLISDYFQNVNNADAIPKDKEEKEMWNLVEFIAEKCVMVDTPLSLFQLAKDYNDRFEMSLPSETIRTRIKSYSREIQKAEFLDTQTSVKQLFGLSATINSDYLEKLRKAAHVEVDKKNRISYYKANNGDLEMRGDHSQSAKTKTAMHESRRSLRSLIRNSFENKNDVDAISQNEEEKEMRNFIEFITEKCGNIESPLCFRHLVKDFNNHFGISRSLNCIHNRIRKYCNEIQKAEFLDTPSKVKHLFGLGATLNSDYIEKLRKDAVVEVDELNRITMYTAKNGALTLHGEHSLSAKNKLGWIARRKNENRIKKHFDSVDDEEEESEKEYDQPEDDSDEYSSEEFDSELESDEENHPMNESEDLVEPSNRIDEFDNETLIRNRSPTEMSIGDNLNFDPPTERSHRSEETEMRQDEQNEAAITENAGVKTRSGRLSKRRHLDSEFSYNSASFRSLEALASVESASSKTAKQKKIAIEKEQSSISSKQSRSPSKSRRSPEDSSFPSISTESEDKMENQLAPKADGNLSDYPGPRAQEMDDYDYNLREDNLESSPINIPPQESEPPAAEENNSNINTEDRSDLVAPEPNSEKECHSLQNNTNSTSQTNGEKVISPEVPIKVEEPIVVEDLPEDVKPEIAHNFRIKFFEAMKSLILFLDTPSLSNLQSKIQQNIRKMKGSNEVLQNNELIPAMELLIARMVNHSVINISGSVESVSLIQFFCYLKASILNSKMIGVEGLINNISGLIEKSQNKRIPMEKVANALLATLDIDRF